jgi:DNA-directed RNA polymerase specialized sigma24 family protein
MPDPTPIRLWTPEEDRVIRREGGGKTAQQLALMLGRTKNAVHQRAYLLRVSLQKYGDADYRTKYSDEVVEQARQMHDCGLGPAEIARRLRVPLVSVRSFVYYQGRHRPAAATSRRAGQEGSG